MIVIAYGVEFLNEIHTTTYFQISHGEIELYEINYIEVTQ